MLWPRKGAGRAPPQRAVLWECERSAWQCGLGAVAWLYGALLTCGAALRGAEQVRQTHQRGGGSSGRLPTIEPDKASCFFCSLIYVEEVRGFLP